MTIANLHTRIQVTGQTNSYFLLYLFTTKDKQRAIQLHHGMSLVAYGLNEGSLENYLLVELCFTAGYFRQCLYSLFQLFLFSLLPIYGSFVLEEYYEYSLLRALKCSLYTILHFTLLEMEVFIN